MANGTTRSIGRADIAVASDIQRHSTFNQYGMRSGYDLRAQYAEMQRRDDAVQAAQDEAWRIEQNAKKNLQQEV